MDNFELKQNGHQAANESGPGDDMDSKIVEYNISMLFDLLECNYETKGYQDGLINQDTHHMEQNIESIKNEIGRTAWKVIMFYEDLIQHMDHKIETHKRNGMHDTAEEIKAKKSIAAGRVMKVKEIIEGLKDNTGDAQGVILSYAKGFKNAQAAISYHRILKIGL